MNAAPERPAPERPAPELRLVEPAPERTHVSSLLPDVEPPERPYVCKCKVRHALDVCPRPTADRDWAAIAETVELTEEHFAALIADPPPVPPNLYGKENLPAWVPGTTFNGRRSNPTAISRSVLGLDFDHVEDRDGFLARLRALGLRAYVHASFTVRNPDGTWRFRVYLFLDRPATPLEWPAVAAWALATFPEVDRGTREIARLFFMPVRVDGYWYELIDGGPLRVDEMPAATTTTPTVPGTPKVRTAPAAANDGPEVEPPYLAVVPLEQREADATAYLARIPREPKTAAGDASGQLVRLASVVTRGFGVPVERAVHVIGAAPIGDAWSDADIRRRCVDAARPGRRELGSKYAPDGFTEHFAAKAGTAATPDEPIPFEECGELPVFPVSALPPVLRDFVLAEAEATQTPLDLAGVLVLGACAGAIAGKVDIQVERGWTEGLNVFTAVALPPSERKSGVFADTFRPLLDAERLKTTEAATTIAAAQTQREMLETRLKKKRAEYSKLAETDHGQEWRMGQGLSKPAGGLALEREIAELAARLEQLEVPAQPRLLCGDVTMEKLSILLAEQHGRITCAAPEGTLLAVAAGRYSKDGASSFEVLLQGHAGDVLRVDRVGRPDVFVRRPRLTVALAIQPSVVEALAKNAAMRSLGLLARFLFSMPVSRVGTRAIDVEPMPDAVRVAYHKLVARLAAVPSPEERAAKGAELRRGADGEVDVHALFRQVHEVGCEIPTIGLTPEARELHRAFRRALEPRLHPETGDLARLGDWAGKLAGAIARIAGVLHVAEHDESGDVSASTMASAIRIGEYFLAHAAKVFGIILASPAEEDARALLAWLTKTGAKAFKHRDVLHRCRRFHKGGTVAQARVTAAAAELEARGYLRRAADGWVVR